MTSFGVVYPARALPEDLPGVAREIEALGYDELWVVEDCFDSGGLALAGQALAATERLTVGVGLLPAAVRNPAIVAMEIATLARTHPGRLTVAFGHGVEAWMRQVGARPSRRLAALGEVVTAVRRLLAGDTVTVDGSFVTLDAVRLAHPPDVAPPVLVGTTGSRGIALAGRRADGLLLPEGCSPAFVADAIRALGDAPLETVVYAWLAADDPDAARPLLAEAISGWVDSGLYDGPTAAAGVDPRSLDAASAAGLALMGTAAERAAAAARFVAAGVDRLVLAGLGPDWLDAYAAFAGDVLPRLRG